ncbi:MAG: hypothetical protein AAFY48_05600, partial [Bacteroidota bacterium]
MAYSFICKQITVIPFDEVRRILLRRDHNSIEGSHLTLIVFGRYEKIKTVISDLEDVRAFVAALKEKVEQYDLKLVQEDQK